MPFIARRFPAGLSADMDNRSLPRGRLFTVLARGRGLVQGDDVKKHRFILFAVAACFLFNAPTGSAAASGWLDDYHKAQDEAKSSHKLLLLNFTGSDWCGWCIRLDQDVFSQSDFKDYASKNLVLMELDFPRPGGPRAQAQTAELQKQNLELARQYNVHGFPTLIVLDGNGQKLWEYEGYLRGADLIAQLEKLRKG
jgi:thioredoxin-related protein